MDETIRKSDGLLLLGAGGHGRVVADMAERLGWSNIAFLDDHWPEVQDSAAWPILGRIADVGGFLDRFPAALATVGVNAARIEFHKRLSALGFTVPSLVHPAASVSARAVLGAGCVVMAGAVINAFARLGDAVIVNTGASIDHDCILEDGAHISPGARLSGTVHVGARSWIGVGASVRHRLTIGADVIIGGGAAVVSPIPDGATAVGVPARVSKAR